MKTMVNNNYPEIKMEVECHYILSNGWEYYQSSERYEQEDDVRFGVVMGYETEIGYFTLSEIRPYIKSSEVLNHESELMPAEGWHWQE